MQKLWNKYTLLFLLITVGCTGLLPAQWTEDLAQLEAHVEGIEYEQEYRHPAHLSWSWNPAKLLIRTGLFVYQKEITYQMNSNCMYGPSCSEFSRQSFELYNPGKGLFMSIDRLMRCNRLSRPRHGEFELHDHHFEDRPESYQFRKPQ